MKTKQKQIMCCIFFLSTYTRTYNKNLYIYFFSVILKIKKELECRQKDYIFSLTKKKKKRTEKILRKKQNINKKKIATES